MPILVRELIIRARVEPERTAPAAPRTESGKSGCDCAEAISAKDLARILGDRKER